MKDIKFFTDIEAIQYLGECACGIHSVTIGDSQVLSQMTEGLIHGLHGKTNILKLIVPWLKDLVEESKLKTDLLKGNTSLERIACQIIIEKLGTDKHVTLIGYGKSGKLIAKILNRENGISLDIINRSPINILKDDLDTKKVKYLPWKNPSINNKSAAVIVAITNTKETKKLIDKLIKSLKSHRKILFIDLSTPSILPDKIDKFVSIEDLSNISEVVVGRRKKEVNKVKRIVEKNLETIIIKINTNIATEYIHKQKQKQMKKLDKDSLELIQIRNQLNKTVRQYLEAKKFVEVSTPYIVGISTDPPKVDKGSTINVDWVNNSTAFLRQSNQIYKQILVASGMKRIYEIGPFWRKEEKESYRHLQESIGLDIEIQNPQKLENLYYLSCDIIKKINSELTTIFKIKNNLKFPSKSKIPVITYFESVKMLEKSGCPTKIGEDLGLEKEERLGEIIKEKYNSDILVIKDYPDTIKKFYTKDKKGGLTETFDIIVDGWELVSGAIRQTNGDKIKKSMLISGIDYKDYEFYISIVDGAVEHGGFCLGLDRMVAKVLGKDNITETTPFPRTYKRLIP